MSQTGASEAMQDMATLLRENTPAASAEDQTMEQIRVRVEGIMGNDPMPEDVHSEAIEITGDGCTIPACMYHPGQNSGVVLYLHGGGYAVGSIKSHQELMARLSKETGAKVLGIDYRLAPENPFPAGLSDALSAYRWLIEEYGVSAENIIISGDSAGGGLSLALLMSIRDQQGKSDALPMPACAVLFSPWTDLTISGESVTTRAEQDPMVTSSGLKQFAEYYHADKPANHPLISPIFGDYHGLPPLLIQVGDHEILLDDATRVAALAKAASVSVELQTFPKAFHVFQAFSQLPEAHTALRQVAEFIGTRVAHISH